MTQSMTGFGKAEGTYKEQKLSIEVRTLNSKNLDINLRAPQQYKAIEPTIRKMISNHLHRGKIEVTITLYEHAGTQAGSINQDLAKLYYDQMQDLAQKLGEKPADYMTHILNLPDIWVKEESALDQEEAEFIQALLEEALKKVVSYRQKEGKEIAKDLNNNLNAIENLLEEVEQYESARIDIIKDRINKHLEQLDSDADEGRFEQELLYYIEKIDINEEKKRLIHHINYFRENLQENLETKGKKIGFISQEMGREINTLGSKSYHADLQRVVVTMKDHLEQIKEQVLNTV